MTSGALKLVRSVACPCRDDLPGLQPTDVTSEL
jgi:hypothetical protein